MLIDTGFDGDIVVPAAYVPAATVSVDYLPARLADGSEVHVPAYAGTAQIGAITIAPALVLALGDVAMVGTNLLRYFTVILDHGRRVIVEP